MSGVLIDLSCPKAEEIPFEANTKSKVPVRSYTLTGPNQIFSDPHETLKEVLLHEVSHRSTEIISIPPFNENECQRRGRFLVWPVKSPKKQAVVKEILDKVSKSKEAANSRTTCNKKSIPVATNSEFMMDSSCLMDEVMSWEVSAGESLNPCQLGSPDLIITCSRGKGEIGNTSERIGNELYLPVSALDKSSYQQRGRFMVWPVDCSKPLRVASVGKLMQKVVEFSKIEVCEYKPQTQKQMIAKMEIGLAEDTDCVAYRISTIQGNLVQLRIWLSFAKKYEASEHNKIG